MTKQNTNNRTEKELKGMQITVNGKQKALVSFVTDTQYVDTHVKVADDYAFPKKSFIETGDNGEKITVIRPLYYVCRLTVDFAQDVKNVSGKGDDVKAKNEEILKNAVGFKAVCRDTTEKAGKTEKGFFYPSASMPCDTSVNVNGSVAGLWAFTSKNLREDFLKMVRDGINSGKYHLKSEKAKGKKPSKRIQDIAKAFGITYEEAEAKMKAIKE